MRAQTEVSLIDKNAADARGLWRRCASLSRRVLVGGRKVHSHEEV